MLVILFVGIVWFISFKELDAGYTANMILGIACTTFIFLGIYRAIYYFKLHQKDYLIIGESSLSIFRGIIFPRRTINFNQIERVVQIDEVIILKLHSGKEEQINTEWLSDKNNADLKKELKQIFGSNAISF